MNIKIEEKKENENNDEKEISNNTEKSIKIEDKNNPKAHISNGYERRITYMKLGINTLLSILLIVFFFYIPYSYEDRQWRIFFFMTLWSFSMNSYYIVSITVIDWIRVIKKDNNSCLCYNNFVRNLYLRICFPFAISIVFLYWMLILLGDDFEYRGRDVTDTATGVFFHGIILIFLLFDMFTARHINRINYVWDLLIISILVCIYFVILGFGKYLMDYEPYDFMAMSSVRQIIGACILIYITILDGYVILNLIGNRFFEQIQEETTNSFVNFENKNESICLDENKPLYTGLNENIIKNYNNRNRCQSEKLKSNKLFKIINYETDDRNEQIKNNNKFI